ncbi:MAG: tripartite tricarboxylate transporter substrate-binding protein, partial [Betaproteobacteria bacterium]
DALKDVVGGHVAIGVVSLPTAIAFVKTGQLRVLGVTSSQRAPQIPDVPTIAELGVTGYELPTWYGMWAPAAMRAEAVSVLSGAIADILRSDDVRQRVIAMGFAVGAMTQGEFTDYVQREARKYVSLASQIGLKKQ